jgi:hypothetical protein
MKNVVLLMFCFFAGIIAYAKTDSIKIKGSLDYLKDGDEVIVTVHQCGAGFNSLFDSTFHLRSILHSFHFTIPVFNEHELIDIMIPKHGKIFTNYLVESKDDIFLTEVDGNTKFTGTGSKKYELQYQLTNIYNYYSGLALHGMDNEMKLKISLRLLDLGLMKCLEYLDLAKAGLSIKEYELLRSERILEKELASKLIMHYNIDNADPANRIKIVTAIKQYQNNEKFLISFNVHPSGLFFKNSSYPSYILWSYQV